MVKAMLSAVVPAYNEEIMVPRAARVIGQVLHDAEIDYEIGPDESMEDVFDTAELLEKIVGEEEVEKMDGLLSLAITGGDCNWI